MRGSNSPGAAALGHLDDTGATEAAYRAIGARCARAGVTLDLAPVADVNVDPRNPVIGLRSFSADPSVAARHVAAAVRGLQVNGVAACLKHFPGHGATRGDTHHEAAVLDRTRAELQAVEFAPFSAGIAAGTRAVMTSHLLVPALDADHLATVSTAINTDVLRGELGFTGTVVTDALEMRALADSHGLVGGFVAALAAGADAVESGALDHPGLVESIPAAVEDAVRDGRLGLDRLEDAARRTAELAAAPEPVVDAGAPDVSARCLEVLGTLPGLRDPLVVECRAASGMATGVLPWGLGLPGADVLRVDGPADLPDRDIVLVVRDPQRHAWQLDLVPRARVVVDCGWPADIRGVPVIRTRGIAPGLMRAAVDLLTREHR